MIIDRRPDFRQIETVEEPGRCFFLGTPQFAEEKAPAVKHNGYRNNI